MAKLSELTPKDHVVELGVRLAGRRYPDGRDVLAGCGLPQLRSGDQAADEGDLVHPVSLRLALVLGDGLVRVVDLVAAHCAHLHVVWIDASGKAGTIAERNRPDLMGLSLLGLAADRRRSATEGRSKTIHMTGKEVPPQRRPRP